LAKLLAGIHGKIAWSPLDAANEMGDPIVWPLFAGVLLFLLREHANGVAYNFRLCLAPFSRQPPDQRFRIGVQTNTQRHETPPTV
jgi:hypothetical protein